MKKQVTTESAFRRLACDMVRDYAEKHLDKTDGDVEFSVYLVWYCKTIQNFKALLTTSLCDGMYYEVTFNGDRDEVYLDAYKKFGSVCRKFGSGAAG